MKSFCSSNSQRERAKEKANKIKMKSQARQLYKQEGALIKINCVSRREEYNQQQRQLAHCAQIFFQPASISRRRKEQ